MPYKVSYLPQFVTIIILFISSGLSAQDYRPGYVVKNDLDSVNGFVAYRSDSKNLLQCVFRETKDGETKSYNPEQLKSFGFHGDKKFRSVTAPQEEGPSKKVFAKQLVFGKMSLYKIRKNFVVQVRDTLIFLPVPKSKDIKNSEGYWSKRDKRYVGVLNYLIKDCQLSADEASYTEGDLTNLLLNYNRCKGAAVSLTNHKPLGKLNFLIFGGYARSEMDMDLFTDVSFSPGYAVLGGIGLELSSPRIFDRLFFTTEVWYHKSFYQAYEYGPFAGNILHQDIYLDVSYVKIPIGFRYNFHNENTPYVKVGMSLTALNDIEIRTWEEVETPDGTVYGDEKFGGYNVKDPKGIWMAVGYDRTLHRKFKMFAEFRYERGEGFIGTAIQSFSTLNSYNLLLGIRF